MNIKIEQTLHGYETGHQLLMSSTPLSSDAKQTLLVQSDLSGSNIDERFKSYITGYPLNKYYAFSKTWYADEMRRPGCVWTQTFLIAFSDLGKIPNLSILTKYFKRPNKDFYEEYSQPIVISREIIEGPENRFWPSEQMTEILSAVYENPERTILIPAISSGMYEEPILQLWSNQWPRLRRNFSFCTGALGLKSLGGKEFDVQVIPRRNLLFVENQTTKGYTVEFTDYSLNENHWIDILYRMPARPLHRFLWLFGSDVEGLRKNYKPLILLFEESLADKANFEKVSNLINSSFPSLDEGVRLKSELFSLNNAFKFSKREILKNLFSGNLNEESWQNLDVNNTLLEAYHNNEIKLEELIEFYLNIPNVQFSESLFDNIDLDDEQLLALVSSDSRLVERFSKRLDELANKVSTWQRSIEIQIQILRILELTHHDNWGGILNAILNADSEIIFDALKRDSGRIAFALRWLDVNSFEKNNRLSSRVFIEYRREFIQFVRYFGDNLNGLTYEKIFQNLSFAEINSIGFDAARWLSCYRKLGDEGTRIFAACVLLSFGFNRKVGNPAGLVVGCFSDVYYFAKAAKVSNKDWGIMPIDMTQEDDEERDPLTIFFNFLNLFSPQKKDVPTWDYCELLIRTLVNKFIKYGWPNQGFLSCLVTEHLMQQAIRYCLSFKKGNKFLKSVLSDIEKRKLKLRPEQGKFMQQVINGLAYKL